MTRASAGQATARDTQKLPHAPNSGSASLNWSRWFRCESSFSLLLVPHKPGIFAVGEEVIAPGESASTGGKRLLAVLQFGECEELAPALNRLFTPASPLYEKISNGECLLRYAVVEDPAQRHAACAALQDWLAVSAETVAPHDSPTLQTNASGPNSERKAAVQSPAPLPAGF